MRAHIHAKPPSRQTDANRSNRSERALLSVLSAKWRLAWWIFRCCSPRINLWRKKCKNVWRKKFGKIVDFGISRDISRRGTVSSANFPFICIVPYSSVHKIHCALLSFRSNIQKCIRQFDNASLASHSEPWRIFSEDVSWFITQTSCTHPFV